MKLTIFKKLNNLYTEDTFKLKLDNTDIVFEKRGNIVFVQISCTLYSGNGVFESSIGALPAKFRPTKLIKFIGTASSNPRVSEVSIQAVGTITLQQTTGTYSFGHIAYYTVG